MLNHLSNVPEWDFLLLHVGVPCGAVFAQQAVSAHKEVKAIPGPGFGEGKISQTPQLTPEETELQEGGFKRIATDREEDARLKKMSALDKFRADAAAREKKHADIAKNSGGMTAAIDRLAKHLKSEETDLEEGIKSKLGAAATAAALTLGAGHAGATPVKSFGKNTSSSNYQHKVPVKLKHLLVKKEETEQIDELKKSTLGSYIKKASDRFDKRSNSSLADKSAIKLRTSDNEYDRGDAEHHKSVLRSKGIAKAVDRLTKEDTEQIDESSDLGNGYTMKKKHAEKYRIHDSKNNHIGDITKEGGGWRYHGGHHSKWMGNESGPHYKTGVESNKVAAAKKVAEIHHKSLSEEIELDEADRGGFTASWRNAKYFGKGVPTNRPMTDKEKVEHEKMKQMQKSLDDMGKNLFKKEDMGHMATKGETGGTAQRKSEYEKAKAAYKEIKTPRGPGHHKEDVGDAKAAVNADGLNTQQQTMQAERSKSARIIKAIYKKKKMVKEDMYDHEKEDKSVKTYGKKPKFDKTDPKESVGEKKPQAAATLSGGKTLTGTDRDTVEIDPVMRNRPGQPDVNKKEDKKDDKKKDK